MSEQELKERIRQEATALFLKYGVRSVSMDDISAQLGVSKKTLYQYYTDKNELIENVLEGIICINECSCTGCVMESENAVHEGVLSLRMIQDMFRTMNTAILYDLKKYHPGAFQIFVRHKNQFLYNMVKQNLERGIREEVYRSDIHVEILTRYRVEAVTMMFDPEIQESIAQPLFDIQREVVIHFLYGVVNPKGYKLLTKYLKNLSQ
ncbi:MAG TPA: TetR/AcrR family transcriptional regulator [Ferruginibacter sp.]|nr:TetR/AcrR family transcriptional regulator [Ferruginibacter sp.]HRO16713.1 TetR/AcrR family transcriptional regulator [Ferruginibacter sp.]HRQ19844.1 TetR/AcrR family transcriptional regulator [Ferruginibacter sp.]